MRPDKENEAFTRSRVVLKPSPGEHPGTFRRALSYACGARPFSTFPVSSRLAAETFVYFHFPSFLFFTMCIGEAFVAHARSLPVQCPDGNKTGVG